MSSTASSPPIVVVEDDPGIGSSLVRTLAGQGWPAVLATSAAEADCLVDVATPLVILDLGLPDADGLDFCRQLSRRVEGLQILILTARSEEADVVLGLDAGAQDYLVKPFRLAELLARVRVCLRRADSGSTARAIGSLQIDSGTRTVSRAGQVIALRPKEFDLLWRLMVEAPKVVSREQLIADVWDEHFFGSTKTLDIHISALRRKLDDHRGASCITTVRSVGYRMPDR
jgi:DNA-binding response OmpR family regulator